MVKILSRIAPGFFDNGQTLFRFLCLPLLTVFLMFFCTACGGYDSVNSFVYETMQEEYYWYRKLPGLAPESYDGPEELLAALRYQGVDRWSYMTYTGDYDAYYEEGEITAAGFEMQYDTNDYLWISLVYDDSPARQAGLRRGDRVLSIDGESVSKGLDTQKQERLVRASTLSITVVDQEGTTNSLEIVKEVVTVNTIITNRVVDYDGQKVAYVVIKNFIEPSRDAFKSLFSGLRSAAIDRLIVDLRYNGGGRIQVARYLGELIGGNRVQNKVFASYMHNARNILKNNSIHFEQADNALGLDRVTFLTGSGTASASELVINGLAPFLRVTLVGAPTHGKPFGMYSYEYGDWTLVPITFTLANADANGDYTNGLPVDVSAPDDFSRQLGDTNEAMLAAALGNPDMVASRQPKSRAAKRFLSAEGFQALHGVY